MSGADAGDLLSALARPGPIDASRTLVILAHPDDEAIALGAQLPRMQGVTLLHVTDGAPRDGRDAARLGFPSVAAYAEARRRELAAAMALAGIGEEALLAFDVPDQEAALDLAGLARRLEGVLRERGVRAVVTHAYEGGHPDHDAVAFAVHAAAARLSVAGEAVSVVEVPLYHQGSEGYVVQRFAAGPGGPGLRLALSEEERKLKRRMYDAHASQAEVLARMTSPVESFRAAPPYDFSRPPNGGAVHYESFGWGWTAARFTALANAALAGLS